MVQIGFIGAGKVGYSLGRYFTEYGSFLHVTGYCSQNYASAEDAANFTHSKPYSDFSQLVADSDVVFLTVPDGAIAGVWNQIKGLPLSGKIICHCSGAITSAVFSEIDQLGAAGCSIHPFFAVSDKYHSYKTLTKALFTMEGNGKALSEMEPLLKKCGLKTQRIQAKDKVLYHAAGAVGSNLMIGLVQMTEELLMECGFSKEGASEAFLPLMVENLNAVVERGAVEALTGPVERADEKTVARHLEQLEGENRQLYRLLSRKILSVAKEKNPTRNYQEMEKILQ